MATPSSVQEGRGAYEAQEVDEQQVRALLGTGEDVTAEDLIGTGFTCMTEAIAFGQLGQNTKSECIRFVHMPPGTAQNLCLRVGVRVPMSCTSI